jgi:hypothetical protein
MTVINLLFFFFNYLEIKQKNNAYFDAYFDRDFSNYAIDFFKDSSFEIHSRSSSVRYNFRPQNYRILNDTIFLNTNENEVYNEAFYKKYFITPTYLIPIVDFNLHLDTTEFLIISK